MGGSQHHAELVGRQHHRDARPGEAREHLSVSGKIVTARQKRRLVDRSSDNSLDFAGDGHFHRAFDCESAQLARETGCRSSLPLPNRFVYRDTNSLRPDDYNVRALADDWVCERFRHYLGTNPAGVAHGHGKTDFRHYILIDT
jgi:hypothetical protein